MMKLMPDSSMNTTMIASITTESKAATLAVRVENPPVPSVENVWHAASNRDRPASCSATIWSSVSAA